MSEPFAEAHGLGSATQLRAIVNGKRRTLTRGRLALSPEYVYALAPGGLMPDDKRFGVLWMGREALAAAYDLEGAFNDVSLSLLRGDRAEARDRRLDALLGRYGGVGAYAREDQLSNWFLMNELEQLADARDDAAGGVPRRRGVSHQHGARAPDRDRAQLDRSAQGLRLRERAIGWHYVKLVLAIAASAC